MRLLLILLLPLQVAGQTSFDGCPATGDNGNAKVQATDQIKNRGDIPARYTAIDFETMIGTKVDGTLNENTAVKVDGYILDIRDGGIESCNCHSKTNRDTHIYVVKDASVTDASKAIVVEVTPRFRAAMGTTGDLKAKYLHKNVTVYGYLFGDAEHWPNSKADKGKSLIWRGSVWEVHPITKIELR